MIVAISLENAVNRARLVRSGVTDFLDRAGTTAAISTIDFARSWRGRSARARHWPAVIDLDKFRDQRSLRPPAGDEALKEVARRAEAEIRAGDTGARFGGDEFAILLAARKWRRR